MPKHCYCSVGVTVTQTHVTRWPRGSPPGEARPNVATKCILQHPEKIGCKYVTECTTDVIAGGWQRISGLGEVESLTGTRLAAGQRRNESDRPLGMSLLGEDFEKVIRIAGCVIKRPCLTPPHPSVEGAWYGRGLRRVREAQLGPSARPVIPTFVGLQIHSTRRGCSVIGCRPELPMG